VNMRWVGVALVLAAPGVVQAQEQLTFSVPYAANLDMSPARLAALLASPEVQVTLNYEPLLAVPGWTGRLGYCAQHRYHVCIKKNWHQVVVQGSDLRRGPDSLSLDLPRHRWFGGMAYRINRTVRVSLPPLWPGDQPGNIDILDISEGRGQQPVVDLHLPAPYVGAGAYRLDKGDDRPASPYRFPPCDATLEQGAQGLPQVHSEYRASAYEDWLRRLTDSDWWALQIPGVRYETLAGQPVGLGGDAANQVIRVASGDYSHIRARLRGLPHSSCPGFTTYEFSWQGKTLTAASETTSPDLDLDGNGQCPVGSLTQEGLWWQGELVSYTGPRVAGGNVTQWSRWRARDSACTGDMDPATPDVTALMEAAGQWQSFSATAAVTSAIKK